MRRLAILLAAMGIMLAMTAGAALAINLVGDNGRDVLRGTAENDVLRGRGGNDLLVGRGNSDRLFGGRGNDVINARDPGRPESDRVLCGPGTDTALIDPSTEDVVAGSCERVRVG